jgi:hypothetical protein
MGYTGRRPRKDRSVIRGSLHLGAIALRIGRSLWVPLGFPLLNRPFLSLCYPKECPNQGSSAGLGGFRSRLARLFSGTEEEECRVFQASIMTPVDSTVSFVEMAIDYPRTQDYAVCEPAVAILLCAVHVVWLPSASDRVSASLRPDQPPAALGTPASLPVPSSLDNRVSEFHLSAPLLLGSQGSIQRTFWNDAVWYQASTRLPPPSSRIDPDVQPMLSLNLYASRLGQ